MTTRVSDTKRILREYLEGIMDEAIIADHVSIDQATDHILELLSPSSEQNETDPLMTPTSLGIVPQWAWRELRCKQLIYAMQRCIENNYSLPQEWLLELRDHTLWLDGYRKK